jgi:outer membrane immunogenic protein
LERFYVGGNAGYAWGRDAINGVETAPVPPFFAIDSAAVSAAASPRLKPDGFTGGGQAGYNWQAGAAVFGVEADIEAFRLRASTTGTFPFSGTLPGRPARSTDRVLLSHLSASTDWLFTGRGRTGWANDHWLLYATGGVAVTNLSVNQTIVQFAPFVFDASSSDTRVGVDCGCRI